ncbi:hypothetical protein WICPIJ_007283 [Wickerhamomyces pijperi]|uniref:Uncharacterized protein n=1 Tax=Wickerhamomyces pijperi TaxID=599730 RepID=A0A9P8Q223_WICPI|nr:hypothetical protein WICPIJ_007283 [Wickerhamomyces pijperi]
MFSRSIRSAVRANASLLQTRQFHAGRITLSQTKPWKTLSETDQREFIQSFVGLYREKNKCSKNYYKQLAEGMDEHDDVPAIWGLIYNDLVEKKLNDETTADFDRDFFKLVKN